MALGASYSLLISLISKIEKSNLEDLRVLQGYGYILSRIAIGVGASIIMYYVLVAKLVQGKFFPDISAKTTDMEVLSFSFLIIWCFVAGFSEKLIPNILTKTEKKFDSSFDKEGEK